MQHPTVLSPDRIRANITRCRKAMADQDRKLEALLNEAAAKEVIPDWLSNRIRETGNRIWSYRKQLDEYEAFCRDHGLEA